MNTHEWMTDEVVERAAKSGWETGDPEVSLEWDANDEGPPCIDFTCPCGHWRHLCNGPDWITEGLGQAPGVECVKCGRAWSLYRVRITALRADEIEAGR